MKILLLAILFLPGLANVAQAEQPYNLTIHVVNFHEDRFIHMYRAEVTENGTPYMLIGTSQHRIFLQMGKDYLRSVRNTGIEITSES